jgi:ribose transport system permease protein
MSEITPAARLHRFAPQLATIVAFLLIGTVFATLSPVFLSIGNIANIANQTAVISVLAFAMTLVMLSGGIDLSVGSIVSLSSVLSASMMAAKFSAALAVTASLAVGALLGLLSGTIAARWRIQTFLVTLGMLSIARGSALVLSGGRTIYIENEGFLKIAAQGSLGPFTSLMGWTVLFFAASWVIINLSTFGRKIRAVGGNAEAARQAGIGVGWVTVRVFALSGMMAAAAGIMLAGRLSGGLPTVGVGLELDAIAAAVLGGTGFKGEGGSLVGTLFGALIMGIVVNGLTLLGINPYAQEIAKGLIIVLAVIVVSRRD